MYRMQSEDESVGGSEEEERAAGLRRTRQRGEDEEGRLDAVVTGEGRSNKAADSGRGNQETDLTGGALTAGQPMEEMEGGIVREVEVGSDAENAEGTMGGGGPDLLAVAQGGGVLEEDGLVRRFRETAERVLNRLRTEGLRVSLCAVYDELGDVEAQLWGVAGKGELGKAWISNVLLPSLDALNSLRLTDLQLDVRDLVANLGGKATCPLSSAGSAYLRASTHHPTPPFILSCAGGADGGDGPACPWNQHARLQTRVADLKTAFDLIKSERGRAMQR